jgi:hypothetical protein
VLDAKTAEQKLRKDVGKQTTKYIQCVVKAAQKCESNGANSGVECHAATGVVDFAGDPVLDPKNKEPGTFTGALGKCDAKFDPSKKGSDYVGIGCPGDCDDVDDGVQQCASMAAFEAITEGDAVKAQLELLAAGIDAGCNIDTGLGTASTDPVQIACVVNNADTLSRYSKGLGKCYEKCENDYKDKKGNGGPNNDGNCLAGGGSADPEFAGCVSDSLAKAEKKNPLSTTVEGIVLGLVNTALNDASDGLYNRFDPAIGPPGNPCGTCGNGFREGAEQCDGGDDALCPGSCSSDCSCP